MGCKLINLGEGATAIICGVPKDHECNSDGPELAFNNNGEYFEVSKRPDWDLDMDEYIAWMEEKNITGGCVSCSICKEPFSFPMF